MPCTLMSAESDESAMLTVSLAQKRRTAVRSPASQGSSMRLSASSVWPPSIKLAPRHPRRRARPACGRRREAPVACPQRGARHARRRVRAAVRRARGGARQVPSRPRSGAAGRSWSKWAGEKDLQLVRRPLFGYPESSTLARMAVIHTCRFRFAASERAGGSLRHACCNNIIQY